MPGVTATGFEIKSLADIKTDIDDALVAAIGSGFDTSLDTPQGQISAVLSDAMATHWELMQSVYASFDIRQATGARLDQLGDYRRIARLTDETDTEYRTRLIEPTNQTQAAVNAMAAAVSAVDGVTNVQVYYNTSGIENRLGQQALTASVIVEGGDDQAIAQAMVNTLVFGLGLVGNTAVNIDDNGLCRTMRFIRPTIVDFKIEITTKTSNSIGACGGTSVANVKAILLKAFADDLNRPGIFIDTTYLTARLLCEGIAVESMTMFNGTLSEYQLTSSQLAKLTDSNVTVTIGP